MSPALTRARRRNEMERIVAEVQADQDKLRKDLTLRMGKDNRTTKRGKENQGVRLDTPKFNF